MKKGSRIRLIGYVLGVAGAALLTALIVREGAAKIIAALAHASWAFPVIVVVSSGRVFSDGIAWAALFRGQIDPGFSPLSGSDGLAGQ